MVENYREKLMIFLDDNGLICELISATQISIAKSKEDIMSGLCVNYDIMLRRFWLSTSQIDISKSSQFLIKTSFICNLLNKFNNAKNLSKEEKESIDNFVKRNKEISYLDAKMQIEEESKKPQFIVYEKHYKYEFINYCINNLTKDEFEVDIDGRMLVKNIDTKNKLSVIINKDELLYKQDKYWFIFITYNTFEKGEK